MTLSERIVQDLKEAMKAGNELRTRSLRSLRAAMLELEKSGDEVNPENELRAVQKQAKMRKDSIEEYGKAGRQDLVDREQEELTIIEEYLPTQLGDDEIRARVRAIVEETGASGMDDFKVVMPKAMGTMKGIADGGRVQAIVREELAKGR